MCVALKLKNIAKQICSNFPELQRLDIKQSEVKYGYRWWLCNFFVSSWTSSAPWNYAFIPIAVCFATVTPKRSHVTFFLMLWCVQQLAFTEVWLPILCPSSWTPLALCFPSRRGSDKRQGCTTVGPGLEGNGMETQQQRLVNSSRTWLIPAFRGAFLCSNCCQPYRTITATPAQSPMMYACVYVCITEYTAISSRTVTTLGTGTMYV